jgi:hypothetical protein
MRVSIAAGDFYWRRKSGIELLNAPATQKRKTKKTPASRGF